MTSTSLFAKKLFQLAFAVPEGTPSGLLLTNWPFWKYLRLICSVSKLNWQLTSLQNRYFTDHIRYLNIVNHNNAHFYICFGDIHAFSSATSPSLSIPSHNSFLLSTFLLPTWPCPTLRRRPSRRRNTRNAARSIILIAIPIGSTLQLHGYWRLCHCCVLEQRLSTVRCRPYYQPSPSYILQTNASHTPLARLSTIEQARANENVRAATASSANELPPTSTCPIHDIGQTKLRSLQAKFYSIFNKINSPMTATRMYRRKLTSARSNVPRKIK